MYQLKQNHWLRSALEEQASRTVDTALNVTDRSIRTLEKTLLIEWPRPQAVEAMPCVVQCIRGTREANNPA